MFIPVIICCPHFHHLKSWIIKWLLNWSLGPSWWQGAVRSCLAEGRCAADGRMACAPVVLGQRRLTEGKQASCWEVSGQRRACSRAADRTARHRGGSALINEGIWKTISGSRFAFNYLINQNSFNSMCSTLCTKMSVEALRIRAGTARLSTREKRGGLVYKIRTPFLIPL